MSLQKKKQCSREEPEVLAGVSKLNYVRVACASIQVENRKKKGMRPRFLVGFLVGDGELQFQYN